MATQGSNRAKIEYSKGTINGVSDVYRLILMASGFSFNPVTHGEYADVAASELPTASGYTIGGITLSGATITQDDINNRGVLTFNNGAWTATGGNLVASGAIIYDDTHIDDVLIGYIDFEGDQTALDGGVFSVVDIAIHII